MIQFTERLDKALRMSARAHDKQGQYRKGGDIPYIIHPVGVMLLANQSTDDEDTLIACLFHDVLEDVDPRIYGEEEIRADFGDKVVQIIKDVTNSPDIKDWVENKKAYLDHLENRACPEAVIVSAADKTHNMLATIVDYRKNGDKQWLRHTTKNYEDQEWWYSAVLEVLEKRRPGAGLNKRLAVGIEELKKMRAEFQSGKRKPE